MAVKLLTKMLSKLNLNKEQKMKKLSQKDLVYSYMINKGSITPLEALNEIGVMRLAAVIHSLKKEGVKIQSEIVKYKAKHYAKYSLED